MIESDSSDDRDDKKKQTEEERLAAKKFKLGSQFYAMEQLGKGTYGTVYKVGIIGTNQVFAVKKIKMDLKTEGIPSTALREIAILKHMQHKNVVRLINTAIGERNIELCLEYLPYDLRKYINICRDNNDPNYNQALIKSIMYQIINATEHLHSHKVLHRDLKPQNILVKINPVIVKLTDFGLSRIYSVPIRPFTREVLTLWYRAPEMILGINYYSTGLDVWSLGCIFGELFKCRPIFMGDCEIDQLLKMFQTFGTFNETMLPGYKSFPYFDKQFPYWKGQGLEKLMSDSYIKMDDKAMDLLKKMLVIDPVKRISCKEALQHEYFRDVVLPNNYD